MTPTLGILFLIIAFILAILHAVGVGDSRLVAIATAIVVACLIAGEFA
jgi:hypothetical protein